MKQLTIRGFDDGLKRRVHELAREEGISLNQAVLRLLRRGAGLEERQADAGRIGAALDDLMGTWSDAEADEMRRAERDFERIDPELWR